MSERHLDRHARNVAEGKKIKREANGGEKRIYVAIYYYYSSPFNFAEFVGPREPQNVTVKSSAWFAFSVRSPCKREIKLLPPGRRKHVIDLTLNTFYLRTMERSRERSCSDKD